VADLRGARELQDALNDSPLTPKRPTMMLEVCDLDRPTNAAASAWVSPSSSSRSAIVGGYSIGRDGGEIFSRLLGGAFGRSGAVRAGKRDAIKEAFAVSDCLDRLYGDLRLEQRIGRPDSRLARSASPSPSLLRLRWARCN
jgi:hypothetical protein